MQHLIKLHHRPVGKNGVACSNQELEARHKASEACGREPGSLNPQHPLAREPSPSLLQVGIDRLVEVPASQVLLKLPVSAPLDGRVPLVLEPQNTHSWTLPPGSW